MLRWRPVRKKNAGKGDNRSTLSRVYQSYSMAHGSRNQMFVLVIAGFVPLKYFSTNQPADQLSWKRNSEAMGKDARIFMSSELCP